MSGSFMCAHIESARYRQLLLNPWQQYTTLPAMAERAVNGGSCTLYTERMFVGKESQDGRPGGVTPQALQEAQPSSSK